MKIKIISSFSIAEKLKVNCLSNENTRDDDLHKVFRSNMIVSPQRRFFVLSNLLGYS